MSRIILTTSTVRNAIQTSTQNIYVKHTGNSATATISAFHVIRTSSLIRTGCNIWKATHITFAANAVKTSLLTKGDCCI
jgi:UDP-glucose 6-dehydrogenase